MIGAALERLAEARIPFAVRGPVDPPPGGDVDVLVRARDAAAAGRVIEAAGWYRFMVAGHPRHAFYLAFTDRQWLKLDVNVVPDDRDLDLPYRAPRAGRARIALLRRLPLAPRRLGPVIAVLGPDGSGKGSVITQLRGMIPVEVTAVYMGNRAPTRERPRARPRRRCARARRPARRAVPRAPGAARRGARLARPRVRLAWRHRALRSPPAGGARAGPRRRRGCVGPLGRLVPRPDAIVLLDAPAEVLFARKGEHSPERLDRWRRAYRETFPTATVVSTEGALGESVAAVSEVVWRALEARRRW